MNEGLHNTSPTFCRMAKATLKDEVGGNVFSYVDGIVMAIKKKTTYISDIAETFTNLREARLNLNPEKCVFGVTRGKVLGCLVFIKGIEANPYNIRAILQMELLQTRKEVQKLTGHIIALNRFIAEPPFLHGTKGSAKVEWGSEQQKAFEDLKLYFQQLPTLSSPEQGQPLILYVFATHSVVSRALVIEKETSKVGKTSKQ
jgi:hypothetical protein